MKKKSYLDTNIAIIALYTVIPSWHGAADISRLLLKYLPCKSKCLFQMISSRTNRKFKNIINQNIFFNSSITKLIFIFVLVFKILKYFSKKKKKMVIIEGASWTFFLYIIAKILKFFLKDLKIIYHAHNVDYEVRKFKNSKIILTVTKIFEKKLLKLADISTSVSKKDQKLTKKLYNIKTILFENGVEKINRNDIKSRLKLPKKFIFFPGSYSYNPNKVAIDEIINIHLKNVLKIFPKYYFVFSGEGLPKKYIDIRNVKYFGILREKDYFYTLLKSDFIFLPLKNAPGTKIKTLQSISLNKIILSSKYAFKGIEMKKVNNAFIYNRNSDVIKMFKYIIKNKNKILIKNKNKNFSKYYFKNIVNDFVNKHL